ncbi:MAG TPA: ParA family protein [Rhodopila sp.]|nr:ParA family protein [Rhodopila sp.]
MKVIGFLSRKGGAGKTTLAIHLAVAAVQDGRRVLLVDLDPQGSAAAWWRARTADTPAMEQASPDQLPGLLDAARAAGVDLAIIDTRPSVEADAKQVAALSDFVLIPTRPAILDLRAIIATLDIIKGSRQRAALVLNACPAPRGAGDASSTIDARNALKAFGVPVAPVAVIQRAALSHALVAGLTALETEPTGKAAKELRALWRHVEKELTR